MERKLFCILEQSGVEPEEHNRRYAQEFCTHYSDYVRLNWRLPDDDSAHLHETGLTWSEGRSALYAHARRRYDYYVFIDDDIRLTTRHDNLANELRRLLVKWRPICATFVSNNWHDRKVARIRRLIPREAYPFYLNDLQVQIVRHDLAELCFPNVYPGNWGSLWYINLLCHAMRPRKQVCFTTLCAKNTRQTGVYETNRLDRDTIVDQMREDFRVPLPSGDLRPAAINRNMWSYFQRVDRRETPLITMDELNGVYRVDCDRYSAAGKHRRSAETPTTLLN